MNKKINNIYTPNIEFREFELDNGMKVILSKMNSIPMVALNTTYHIGSKDENPDLTGIAHLFEHLMFEGSANVGKGMFDDILNKNGGNSNAYTSWDSTSYYIVLPSPMIETALWLDSDRLCGAQIDIEQLKTQKKIVSEEKLQVQDNVPYGSIEEESSKRLFKLSGYRWPIIGYENHMINVSIDDVNDFYKKYYTPNNAVLSVVGDIDYEKTRNLIEKYYSDIKPGTPVKRKNFTEYSIEGEIYDIIYSPVNLPARFIFYRTPEMGSKYYYALQILGGILSIGESSRLYRNLVYEKKLAKEIEAYTIGLEHTGIFSIECIANKDASLEETGNSVDEIIYDISRNGLKKNEIEKIKNKIETNFNFRMQSIISIADRLSYYKTFFNDCSKINTEIINYLDITPDDIYESIDLYLNKSRRVVLDYLSNKKKKNEQN